MKLKPIGIAVVSAVVVFSLGFSANQIIGATVKQKTTKPAANATAAQVAASMSDEQQAIFAVRTAKASVVNIVGISKTPNGNADTDPTQSSGTGIIISSDGYIVSNSHVVNEPGDDYEVIFSDGSRYDAQVVGMDPYTDVGLIHINAAGLPAAKLGDSNALETGQTVFAIGNSLGRYQNTVTRGVVSGLGRNVPISVGQPRMRNLIQTDAAINPGNSGGPLINMNGEVVGINTLIDTQGQGVGFSIPVNIVKTIVDQLKANGKISHPYLGVSYQTVDKTIQAYRGLTVNQGAYIANVMAGSPAAAGGLEPGDVITAIENIPLTQSNELDSALQNFQAGSVVNMTVIRNGQSKKLAITLGEYKAQ